MRHLGRGETAMSAAIAMGISEQYAKNLRTEVYAKLGAGCFADALRALGWLVVPDA